jgi:hypothetical protein
MSLLEVNGPLDMTKNRIDALDEIISSHISNEISTLLRVRSAEAWEKNPYI